MSSFLSVTKEFSKSRVENEVWSFEVELIVNEVFEDLKLAKPPKIAILSDN